MALATLKPKLTALDTRTLKIVVDPTSWRAGKQGSTARGYGYKWQMARAGHLRKSPLCVMCKAAGRLTAATVVDHSIPHRGDMTIFWERSNWQSLCKPHHDGEAQRRDGSMG